MIRRAATWAAAYSVKKSSPPRAAGQSIELYLAFESGSDFQEAH
jgi:hypothetical protein